MVRRQLVPLRGGELLLPSRVRRQARRRAELLRVPMRRKELPLLRVLPHESPTGQEF
jgi:hypothetical protein